MKKPIFLEPVFQERIWGGTALRNIFGYDIPSEKTGECWAISGHANGQSTVINGDLKGKKLDELWRDKRELFGDHPAAKFPLLVKLLDANSNLSVQVHPNDEYVKKHKKEEFGKSECWYVLDCKENAEIVLGHKAKTKEELIHLIEKGEWDNLLKKIPVKKGDFFYVPSGTIHALGEGTLILEIQQSSDTTFRIYDYDRLDDEGKKRELHLKQAIEVTSVPHHPPKVQPVTMSKGRNRFIKFIESEHFSVCKWEITEKAALQNDHKFLLVSIISGCGVLTVDEKPYLLNKGDHLILPAALEQFYLEGNFTAVVSKPRNVKFERLEQGHS
ncbi:mannose-6-phosphate isomerase, class I [Bacillus sp. ISL-47]|uniref:mannose-6-phosphate isomerase, class I n=1 Tax=Bacillus sp. ISL-47 TaxID=2819130 RepID=UPI001BE8032E|nr:mannose-6-phosphate isomerase, class I [Bacillus sp. ISL-47]MBT2711128.1 mannose-6-phosphate isomerase, class I [Pseudomonas sp. ISL-84]